MKILALSVSHENAPLKIRECLSFTKRKQAEMLGYIRENMAKEAVIVSTCNRFEVYTADMYENKLTEYISQLAGQSVNEYITIYEGTECCSHLMMTAAGLNSMILGEDQILGQVRDAELFAQKNNASGKYLNTLFRLAITGAKRVKTDTLLSKTPVSAATIALKLCRCFLGTLDNKNVLIIGASGKTGGAVLKNLASMDCANIYATTRKRISAYETEEFEGAEVIGYDERYEHLDMCDAVISATLSPHLTLTAEKTAAALKTVKPRIFIDLAVPRDIEVNENTLTAYKNVDDLADIAENNARIKLEEVEKAKEILRKYEQQFYKWVQKSEEV